MRSSTSREEEPPQCRSCVRACVSIPVPRTTGANTRTTVIRDIFAVKSAKFKHTQYFQRTYYVIER